MTAIEHLNHCEQQTALFCGQLVQQCWQQLDQQLDQMVAQISDPARRTRHYVKMQEVRFKADQVSSAITTYTQTAFKHFEQCLPPVAADTRQQPQEGDQQQDSLAISRAMHNTLQSQHQAIWQLNMRLSLLRGGQRCEESDNPLSPAAICLTFQSAVRDLDIDPRTRLALYQTFSTLFQEQIGDFYGELNRYLIDAGILPHLLPTATDAAGPAAAASPQPEAHSHNKQQLQQIMLLLRRQTQWPATINHAIELPGTLATESYIGAVSLLQRQIAAHVDFQRDQLIDPGSTMRQYFKYLITQTSRQHAGIDPERLLPVELVTRLFQQLCSDEQLPLQLRCLVSYLHAPCIKLALTEDDFLASPQHSARELLDLMLQQGSLSLLSHDEDPSLLKSLRRLVSTLACDLTGTSGGFSQALSELRNQLALLSQRAAQTERREVQIQAGMDSLDQARTLAQNCVHDAMVQHRVQRGLSDYVVGPCTDFLTFVLLQHGQGRHWQQARHLLKGIALSVRGPLLKEQLIQFQRGQQRLYNAVRRGLSESGYAGMLAGDLLSCLHQAQQQLVQNMALTGPSPRVETQPKGALFDRQQLDQLQIGQWYQLLDRPQSDPIVLKLAWHSEDFGRALLVDTSGSRRRIEYADTLLRALARGQILPARLVSNRCSGQALEQILHQLRLNSLRNKLMQRPAAARKTGLKIC